MRSKLGKMNTVVFIINELSTNLILNYSALCVFFLSGQCDEKGEFMASLQLEKIHKSMLVRQLHVETLYTNMRKGFGFQEALNCISSLHISLTLDHSNHWLSPLAKQIANYLRSTFTRPHTP